MAKPFLKWAGGKRQLIPEIAKRLPSNIDEIDNYVEPFIGGGALLFYMLENYKFEEVHICDRNPELILCYSQIKNSVGKVISYLAEIIENYPLESVHRESYFYEIRKEWNSNLDIETMNDREKSKRVARTIFLNKTCYNGLFRVNRNAEFNVPFGRYKNPSFPSNESLRECSVALENVTIHCDSYQKCIEWVTENTLIYFDPPYRPISKTSSFKSYSKYAFDDEEQKELANLASKLDLLGAKIILSNSDPKNYDISDNFFDKLYSSFIIERVAANRAINSNTKKRGAITELLVRNY